MARWIKLVYKNQSLNLEDGTNYEVRSDFVPPSISREVNYSYGSYSNRSGGTRLSDKPLDRQFGFSVNINGATMAETHGLARKLANFLENARDPNNGLYLEYCPNAAIPYQPIYGQQAVRYRIKAAAVSFDPSYYINTTVQVQIIVAQLNLTIGPYAEGSKQAMALGYGGLVTDTIGPGGVVITEGNTNKFSNPIFENITASWSVGGSASHARNYFDDYILFGNKSDFVSSDNAVGQLYQAVNVGNTNAHCLSFYAKKADSSAVTVADGYVYYGASVATTYQAVGDGWYRCYGTVTGVASNTNSGIQVAANKALYVDMFQLEEDAYPTYPMYGDMPGCSWGGTPHAASSTTTRNNPYLPPEFSQDTCSVIIEMTVRIAVRWHHANTFPNDRYLLDGIQDIYFKASDDKIYLGTLSSSAQTFSANAVYIYHFVISPTEMSIYINGTQDGTTGTSSEYQVINTARIGSTDTPGSYGNLTLLDFAIFPRAATTAQVLADYNNMTQLMGSSTYGEPVNPPPWMSRYDSATIDNYYDSTHQDWAVFGGVPGDMPAETTLWISNAGGTVKPLLINCLSAYNPVYMPTTFANISGTADAAALGGSAQVTALTTAETAFPTTGVVTVTQNRDEYVNKNLYLVTSVKDAAAGTVYARAKMTDNAGAWAVYSSPYNTLSTGTVYTTHLVGPLEIPEAFDDYTFTGVSSNFKVYCSMYRSAGTSNVSFDYYRAMVGDIAYFPTGGTTTLYIINDGIAKGYASNVFVEVPEYRGDVIEFKPGMYNYLTIWSQGLSTATDTTQVTNVTYAYVTPRWSIT